MYICIFSIQECLGEKVKEALCKIKHKKLFEALNTLLYSRDKNQINSLKISLGLIITSLYGKKNISGLERYKEDFNAYRLSELPPGLRKDSDQAFSKEMINYFTLNGLSIQGMESVAEKYLNERNYVKTLLCFENIIKDQVFKGTATDVLKYCEKILHILKQDASISPHPLLYSTLGICFYEKGEFQVAAEMFSHGCKIAEDRLHKLILLNNYGCLDYKFYKINVNQNYDNLFKEAYLMIHKEIAEDIDHVMDQWLSFDFTMLEETFLSFLSTQRRDRLNSEILISLCNVRFLTDIERPEKLFITVFFNFCINLTLPLDNILGQLGKFQQYISTLSNINNKTVKLPGYLEVFVYLYEFADILMDIPDTGKTHQEVYYLNSLKKESKLLVEKKKNFFNLFKEEKMVQAFKELKNFEIFFLMIGLVLRFRKKDPHISYGKPEMIKRKADLMFKYSDSVQLMILEQSIETIPKDKKQVAIKEFRCLKLAEKVPLEGLIIPQSLVPYVKFYGYQLAKDKDSACLCVLNFLHLQIKHGITKEVCKGIVESLRTFGSLEKVYLEWNGTKNNLDLFELLDGLILLKAKLKLLLFNIDDEYLKKLKKSISSLQFLEHLSLTVSGIGVTTEGIHFIIDFINKSKDLKELSFYFDKCPRISDESVESLVQAISHKHLIIDLTLNFYCRADVSVSKMKNHASLLCKDLPLLRTIDVSHDLT